MPRLSESDYRAVLEVLREAGAVDGPDPFPEHVLEGLRELVPCDVVAYHEGPISQPALVFTGEPRGEMTQAIRDAHERHLPQDPLTPVEGTTFQSGDTVSIKLFVRNACSGSSKNSGSARLWFNDSAANSRFDATIGTPRTYFLRDAFALATTPGPGPKKTIDVAAGAKCSPYKTFGTWTTTIP